MSEPLIQKTCGCHVGAKEIGEGLELFYCPIHAYAPALFIEVLDVIDYFSDDWPEPRKEELSINMKRKQSLIDLIKIHAVVAQLHDFEKSEHWPAIKVCTACGKTVDEGNHY
ncbi:MAG: hypothetical protein DWQ07_17615 [Chloroflexi bacterium]|nr:MAG: hypothetical protein DWQ07_17615 [Chloroflexota bacterium]